MKQIAAQLQHNLHADQCSRLSMCGQSSLGFSLTVQNLHQLAGQEMLSIMLNKDFAVVNSRSSAIFQPLGRCATLQ